MCTAFLGILCYVQVHCSSTSVILFCYQNITNKESPRIRWIHLPAWLWAMRHLLICHILNMYLTRVSTDICCRSGNRVSGQADWPEVQSWRGVEFPLLRLQAEPLHQRERRPVHRQTPVSTCRSISSGIIGTTRTQYACTRMHCQLNFLCAYYLYTNHSGIDKLLSYLIKTPNWY